MDIENTARSKLPNVEGLSVADIEALQRDIIGNTWNKVFFRIGPPAPTDEAESGAGATTG